MKLKFKAKNINKKISENYTKIKLSGKAEITSGENTIKCKNKFTRYLMSQVVLFIATAVVDHPVYTAYYRAGIGYAPTARVGTDTETPTNPNMNDLVSKIDTAPSSWTTRLIRDEGIWLYSAEFIFTWNSGVLPDTYIGEIGVYSFVDGDGWSSPYQNPNHFAMIPAQYGESNVGIIAHDTDYVSRHMIARIASADGAFDEFYHYGSVDPLTFKWRFQVMII